MAALSKRFLKNIKISWNIRIVIVLLFLEDGYVLFCVFDVYQVLNLFLALLLSSFGAESLKHSEEDEGPNKLQEAIDRINRFVIFIKSHILYCIKVKGCQTVLALQECDSATGYSGKTGLSNTGGTNPFSNGRIHDHETSLDDTSESPQHHCGK